eukprot:gene10393-biopygen10820
MCYFFVSFGPPHLWRRPQTVGRAWRGHGAGVARAIGNSQTRPDQNRTERNITNSQNLEHPPAQTLAHHVEVRLSTADGTYPLHGTFKYGHNMPHNMVKIWGGGLYHLYGVIRPVLAVVRFGWGGGATPRLGRRCYASVGAAVLRLGWGGGATPWLGRRCYVLVGAAEPVYNM